MFQKQTCACIGVRRFQHWGLDCCWWTFLAPLVLLPWEDSWMGTGYLAFGSYTFWLHPHFSSRVLCTNFPIYLAFFSWSFLHSISFALIFSGTTVASCFSPFLLKLVLSPSPSPPQLSHDLNSKTFCFTTVALEKISIVYGMLHLKVLIWQNSKETPHMQSTQPKLQNYI